MIDLAVIFPFLSYFTGDFLSGEFSGEELIDMVPVTGSFRGCRNSSTSFSAELFAIVFLVFGFSLFYCIELFKFLF